MAIVYACLLAVIYFFVIVREATVVQITLTFASAGLAPFLFFLLQTMVASDTESIGAAALLRRSLAGFWKVVLVTLPLIAFAILIGYLLGKVQGRIDAPSLNESGQELMRRAAANARATKPIEWRVAILLTVRYLFFGLLLPLAAIHLWLAVAQPGFLAALKKIPAYLARAFAPRAVLIYVAGFVVFAVVPYYLLFRTTQTSHAWIEISLLLVRLFAVFILTLGGWIVTVRSLGRVPAAPEPATKPEPVAEAA